MREIDPAKLVGLADPGFEAPDSVGVAEGWRAWRTSLTPPPYGLPPKLESVTNPYEWLPRVKSRAECTRCEEIPGSQCTCGFYSAKSLEHLRTMGYHTYGGGDSITVVGKLANWGRVIEGSQGWRSEFAYPMVLYVPFEAWRIAKPLAEGFGVPVKLLNLLDPKEQP